MWGYIGGVVATLLTGFIGGVFGSFVSSPVAEFYRLRRNIRSRMHYFDNVQLIDRPDLRNARDSLRGLATDLLAFAETESPVVKLLSWRGYDLNGAARSLLGFSNSLTVRDGSRACFRDEVERGLKLPLSYP